MAKKKTLQVHDAEITLITKGDEEYINLTDIARNFEGEPAEYLRNWLRTGNTIQYLGAWEKLHNPEFNIEEFQQIKSEVIDNRFIMSAKKWIGRTNAIGIDAKAGRYGGTYAHNEIALQFATWLSPEFQVMLIKEYKTLKIKEAQEMKDTLEWNVKRVLTKMNYRLQTEAIKENLIPKRLQNDSKKQGFVYASEADILNIALFGMTAKEWRVQNPTVKGNIRDFATTEQLSVLSNLESHNAEMIRDSLAQDERLHKLNEIAIFNMRILVSQKKFIDNVKNQLGKGDDEIT